ncbi:MULTISPECIES: bifunctional diguanylate cyclase/phosphodiesterase [unclassified Pseudoxanthomonas]|uniref:putative bifunctional diguanylate cyclase/phosphodiesterase n=1 Tax=unclassified Pseudoxanthomonas TaxID=2645906 RepID=UPI0008EB32D2|nr:MULTISPECIES: bifunctional diguanylate cyclase/phosphodiesterase [unclassified Pseudoxanthomonas]PPJ42998.1 bifunctional diguanylate cyclase/phosphodiesterase [Pseudoxanthomonas sp. KAs_5_3]SFV33884.1 diguanylate cyclase (GGDEF) domain-containing protein [Pseudoxanthomonas sp. YR558]
MSGTYNEVLVLFSLLVAILASYTALDMAGRVTTTQGTSAARWWLAGGAMAMGLGIWSMHFVGMLAFDLPIPLGYDLAITLYSMLAAVGVSAFALWLVSRPDLPVRLLCLGAVLMGAGIAVMHYIGMAALRMQPGIDYDPLWFALSIVIAVVASGAALWIAFHLRRGHRRHGMRLIAAVVMGFAIVGMHYTGMAAARFPADSWCGAARDGGVPTQWLAVLVVVATVAIMGIALIVSVLDRQMHLRTRHLAISLARANEELVQAALHDPLTKLPNRVLLQDRIEQAIEKAKRKQESLAVMFLDLDGFKSVNDAYGHQAGDLLLADVATRVRGLLRSQDTLSRLGGDEFVLVAPTTDPDDAAVVAQRILDAVALPIQAQGIDVQVTASIGIAMYPSDGMTERDLMAHADAAMYHTKDNGRNGYTFFAPSMNISAHQQLKLLNDLRRAVERNELVLHYQPKFAAPDYRMAGVEALLRWQHPDMGLLPPGAFIAAAERSGLILSLGEWVLDEACRQLHAWDNAGHDVPTIAVNLSPLQFSSPSLVETVRDTLARHALDPTRLTLEITETTAMRDADASVGILDELTRMGVRISIDDFGTGYSSLLYLKRLPATELKIDRAFVRELESNADDAAIVASIVALGRTLNLKVVAEGVETPGQQQQLRQLGCDFYQGYLLGEPVAADRLVHTRHAAPAPCLTD